MSVRAGLTTRLLYWLNMCLSSESRTAAIDCFVASHSLLALLTYGSLRYVRTCRVDPTSQPGHAGPRTEHAQERPHFRSQTTTTLPQPETPLSANLKKFSISSSAAPKPYKNHKNYKRFQSVSPADGSNVKNFALSRIETMSLVLKSLKTCCNPLPGNKLEM